MNEEGAGCTCVPSTTATCYEGPNGTLGVGQCAAGTKTCAADGKSYGACTGQVLPAPEVCNGTTVDEDCDGNVNEEGTGCTCVPGTTAACYEGPAGTAGVGACKAGTFTCLPSGEGYGPCNGQIVPKTEVCDGTLVDEDCNNAVNESGTGCVCVPGSKKSCYNGPAGTLGVGACIGGLATCDAKGTGYGPCVGEVVPKTDSCSTAADEDCNGSSYTCTSATKDCADATGTCEDSCSDAVLGKSNVGCVVYPTVTPNVVASTPFHYGVAVANTSDKPANVTVTKGTTTVATVTVTVAARSAKVIELPWVSALKEPTSSVQLAQGAYKLVATRGVTVSQFNALEYQIGGSFSYTNDASMLLPVNAWGGTYRVASWKENGASGFVTVVAQTDNTVVTFKGGARVAAIKGGVTGLTAQGDGSVTLNAGDVVQLLTNGTNPSPNDLTGMLVTSFDLHGRPDAGPRLRAQDVRRRATEPAREVAQGSM